MKILVCYNPYSNAQRIGKNIDLVKKILSKKYDTIDIYESEYSKSITDKIVEVGALYDTIFVSGGDGTINEAINGAAKADIKTPIAYIPSGTVNDVGQILHLRKNLKKGLEDIVSGIPAKVDVCRVNDKYFLYVFACGKFSAISYDVDYKLKKHWGKMAYIFRGIKEVPKESGMNLTITTPDEVINTNSYIFFGFNSQQFGGIKFYRKKKPLLDDGLMDFTFVEKKRGINFFRMIRFVFFGDLQKIGVKTYTVSRLKIECDKEMDFNTDGEYAFSSNSCDIEVLRRKVNIIVPKKIYYKYFNN